MTHDDVMGSMVYALAAACCLALMSAPPVKAQGINTFSGSCTAVPVTGYWPEPLKFTPQNGAFIAILDGGSCTGTVNGEPVNDIPMAGRVEMHGIQSCSQAEIDGRAHTVIDGKDFYSSVHERRTERDAAIAGPADSSGVTILKAYGRIGLVKDSDPIAQEPLVRPFAEPMDLQEFTAACAGPGLEQVSILIELAVSPTGISSPAREDSWQDGPPPGSSPLASLP
jgi:hypothetical protein